MTEKTLKEYLEEEVYCICGCGRKRPPDKMYHYGVPETGELIGPVIKFHKLAKHLVENEK